MHRSSYSIVDVSRGLLAAFREGYFGSELHEKLPDLDRGSREFYLYLTLAPALNYQRNSDAFWRSAVATWQDPDTQFVFFPENTSRGLGAYRDALTRHGLALQPTKHTGIWFQIAETLRRDYNGDPRVLIGSSRRDVEIIRQTLLRRKRDFPYLSGPKLSNYWLYLLDFFTDVSFTDRSDISVVADSHVIGASIRLGLVEDGKADAVTVGEAWKSALEGSQIAPCDLHAPLWRWSRAGFPDVDQFIRVEDGRKPPVDAH